MAIYSYSYTILNNLPCKAFILQLLSIKRFCVNIEVLFYDSGFSDYASVSYSISF